MLICAAIDCELFSLFAVSLLRRTICVSMMLNGNAQDLEAVHTNSCGLDPLLALQNHIHRPSEETDKSISLACGKEDFGELELEDLAHNFQGRLELRS